MFWSCHRRSWRKHFHNLNITRNGDALPEDSGVREDVQQDFDENFEDTYSNQDGAYIDPNYQPDYDSWATSPESRKQQNKTGITLQKRKYVVIKSSVRFFYEK